VINESRCHCGLGPDYQSCCGRFVSGDAIPETAEQLMRSRYSAFCREAVDYLTASLHPSKRKPSDTSQFRSTVQSYQWLGLEIVGCQGGGVQDLEGTVEFVASCFGDKPGQLREKSRFVKEDGRWFYLDGDVQRAKKPGRNDPCWCQNGKKFKKCHGRRNH
jgi:SEC-C motif domain protein